VEGRRRLRRLSVDGALIRRRAAGEPLRELARDYGVAHSTLSRYFARPELRKELKEAERQLRVEQRQLRARRLAERRLEQEVRRRAEEQAALKRGRERRYRAEFAEWSSDRRPWGDSRATWLHNRYEPELRLAGDLHSTYDQDARQVVAEGGGTEALLAATELPTLESAAAQIDAVILARAFDNDALARAQPQPVTLRRRPRLRRLVPDSELLRRRASGEPLRTLASDYAVAHTTLARFFAQPEITHQLRQTSQQLRAERRARTSGRRSAKRQNQ
jgi:lambda repressor-like predicted transcriptional regulator